jgi:hypothetical protein
MSVALARKTDDRAELRAAIENAAAVKAELTKRQGALEQAVEYAGVARMRLETATAAIGRAKEEHAGRLARAFADGREPPTAILQDTRDMADAARDAADAAKAAAEAITTGIKDLQVDAVVAGRAVDDALRNAVEPVLFRLIAQARALHSNYLATQAVMTEVAGLFDAWHPARKAASFVGLAGAADDARVMDASVAMWRSALAALRNDPDFDLPSIGEEG